MALPESTPPTHDADAELHDRLREMTTLLKRIAFDRTVLDGLPAADRERLSRALAGAFLPDAAARRRRLKAVERAKRQARAHADDQVFDGTGIRSLRRRPVFTTPNRLPPGDQAPVGEAREAQRCYVCSERYTVVHHFYDQLCPACASLNFAKRTELADLRGRVALVTGGRVKIGYQAVLKLLRAGAEVVVTTRFPRDAAARYALEPDVADWGQRLRIHGLDMRHPPSVEAFCGELLATRTRLDFIINNACQTVRRPPGFYAHMMAGERAALATLPADARLLLAASSSGSDPEALSGQSLTPGPAALSALLSQIPLVAEDFVSRTEWFPDESLDQDRQQVDLRGRNSWRLLLAEVSSVELLEVHLVNAIAPFIINARLKPLMLRGPERDKHIINVSAVEGQFYRNGKTTRHPHTNMAKAALNMMTRTSATDYFGDGIHMNSVDTGWVTDEDPAEIAARKRVEQRFHPPLDIIDGAARIVDPIISGFNTGIHAWGKFLKDYRPTDW